MIFLDKSKYEYQSILNKKKLPDIIWFELLGFVYLQLFG